MIEMNRDNIRIDPVLEMDTDWNPPCISAYVEIWLDADEKFGTHTHGRDNAWINLYAIYSPVYHTLQMEYYIETDTSVSDPIAYEPTEDARQPFPRQAEPHARRSGNRHRSSRRTCRRGSFYQSLYPRLYRGLR